MNHFWHVGSEHLTKQQKQSCLSHHSMDVAVQGDLFLPFQQKIRNFFLNII